MKKITLTADEDLIKRAQAKARAGNTTLTNEFRRWLEAYAADVEQQVRKPEGSRLSRCVDALKRFEKKLEEKL